MNSKLNMQKITSDYEGAFNKVTKRLSFKYKQLDNGNLVAKKRLQPHLDYFIINHEHKCIMIYVRFWLLFKTILVKNYTDDEVETLIIKKYKLPDYPVYHYVNLS